MQLGQEQDWGQMLQQEQRELPRSACLLLCHCCGLLGSLVCLCLAGVQGEVGRIAGGRVNDSCGEFGGRARGP